MKKLFFEKGIQYEGITTLSNILTTYSQQTNYANGS